MLFAFVLLFLVTAGGFAVTYLFDDDAPFFARICAGTVIGQIVFALAGFLLGWTVGMSAGIAFLAAVVAVLPVLVLTRQNFNSKARADFSAFVQSIKDFMLRPNAEQIGFAVVYLFFVALVWFFFERAMFNLNGGIATGNIHNTGDLSFHLQAIYGFLDGQNFPPQNPSFAGAKFTYPFMVDLVTAMLSAVGAKISEAKFWQNMFLIVALIVLMRRFTLKLTNNIFAANIAPIILLLSGGLGFLLFFSDALKSEIGLFGWLMKMPENYTIRGNGSWRWGNTLCVLFMTQRSILFGLPLALIVFTKLWEVFTKPKTPENSPSENSLSPFLPFSLSILTVGILAGTLPLVHAHSFAVVMGMAGCLAILSFRRWREWMIFFAGAAVVSVPELLWAMRNSASKMQTFIGWEFGWDNGDTDPIFFWIKNTGIFIPLLFGAIAVLIIINLKFLDSDFDGENENPKSKIQNPKWSLLLFWLPFALCFIIPNVVRLAPWVWDNIKVLIYWFVLSIPLVAWLLAQLWQRGGRIGQAATIALIFVLVAAGWLDVWRVASRQMEYVSFDRDKVALAREVRQKTPPKSIVASAPFHDSPAALFGRRWFMGFTGHLWSHGIDANNRESILREIYYGGENAEKLLRENEIDYLVIGPQEYDYTVVNDAFLRRFPVVAQSGEYRLLKVR